MVSFLKGLIEILLVALVLNLAPIWIWDGMYVRH